MSFVDFTDWADAMGYVPIHFKVYERIKEKEYENNLYYENYIGKDFTLIEQFEIYPDNMVLETDSKWTAGAGDINNTNCYGKFINGEGKFYDYDNANHIEKFLTFIETSSGSGWSKVRIVIDYKSTNIVDSNIKLYFNDGTTYAMIFGLIDGKAYIYEGATARILQKAAVDIDPTGKYTWEFWFDETNKKVRIFFNREEVFAITGFDDYQDVLCGALAGIYFITLDASNKVDVRFDNIAVDWISTEFYAWVVRKEMQRDEIIGGLSEKDNYVVRVDVLKYPVANSLIRGDTIINDGGTYFEIIDRSNISEYINMVKFIVR